MSFHLRTLTIRTYQGFQGCPRLEFTGGHQLVLGVNGAGKSTLLRLLHAVLAFDFRNLEEEFDVTFEFDLSIPGPPGEDLGAVTLKGQARKRAVDITEDSSLRLPTRARERTASRRYELEFQLQVASEHATGFEYQVRDRVATLTPTGDSAMDMSTPSSIDLGARPLAALVWHSRRLPREWQASFDELLPGLTAPLIRESDDVFAFTTHSLTYSKYALHPSPIVDLQPDAFHVGLLPRTETLQEYGPDDTLGHRPCAPFLKALNANRLTLQPRIIRRGTDTDGAWFDVRGVEIRVRFESGLEVVDSELTFGQRRFLSMVFAAHGFPEYVPILIDEIDNGLHPGLVLQALRMLDGRQTFIASHDKLVVDQVNYESPDDLRRKIIIVRRQPDGSQIVVQLDPDQAQRLYDKIDVGIMEPSEVLLGEGLW